MPLTGSVRSEARDHCRRDAKERKGPWEIPILPTPGFPQQQPFSQSGGLVFGNAKPTRRVIHQRLKSDSFPAFQGGEAIGFLVGAKQGEGWPAVSAAPPPSCPRCLRDRCQLPGVPVHAAGPYGLGHGQMTGTSHAFFGDPHCMAQMSPYMEPPKWPLGRKPMSSAWLAAWPISLVYILLDAEPGSAVGLPSTQCLQVGDIIGSDELRTRQSCV